MMKNYSARLKGFLVTKKSWRTRPQNISNDLQEDLPWALAMRRGLKDAKRGWTSVPFQMFWRSGEAYLSESSRTTTANILFGWKMSGPLANQIRRKKSLAASKAAWAQKDNMRFGIDGDEWVRLRWSRSNWAKKRTQGWSGSAMVLWFCWFVNREAFDLTRYFPGLPKWYTTTQP
jgi:hypothetical protein